MDVTCETTTGKTFSIELWYFDTVLEIKQRIEKFEGIPVASQKLFFKGKVMDDNRDTEYYKLVLNSRIQLIVESPETTTAAGNLVKVEDSSRVHITIRTSFSKRQFSLEVDVMDTVSQLKERVRQVENIPVSRFALLVGNAEMHDHRTLAEYGIGEQSLVSAVVRPFPPAAVAAGHGGGNSNSKKLRVMVLPKCGTKRIPVEVNASDNVSELRKELQRLQSHGHFHLPAEGYFFIYKQIVMEEDRTFRWHEMRQNDTIEIFNGSISGGS